MSEYVNAEIHETEDTIEIRFEYGDKQYGLVMAQEMFDFLDVSCGQQTPTLVKLGIGLDHPAWTAGVSLEGDYVQNI